MLIDFESTNVPIEIKYICITANGKYIIGLGQDTLYSRRKYIEIWLTLLNINKDAFDFVGHNRLITSVYKSLEIANVVYENCTYSA